MKKYSIVQHSGDEYGPGCLEVIVEGEKFGGGAPRGVGFDDATAEGLARLLTQYPGARVVNVRVAGQKQEAV